MNRVSTIIAGLLTAAICLAGCATEERVIRCEGKLESTGTEAAPFDTGLTFKWPWPTEQSEGRGCLAFESEEDMAAFIAELKGKSASEVDRMIPGAPLFSIIGGDRGPFRCPGSIGDKGPFVYPETGETGAGEKTDHGKSEVQESERSYEVTAPRRGSLVLYFDEDVVFSAEFAEAEESPVPGADESPGRPELATLKSLADAAADAIFEPSELADLIKHIEDAQWDDPNCLSFDTEAELADFVSKLKGKSLAEVEKMVGNGPCVILIMDDSLSMTIPDEDGAGEKDDEGKSALRADERRYPVRKPRRGRIVLKLEKDVVTSAEFVETKTEKTPKPGDEKN